MRKYSFTCIILATLFAAIISSGPTCELLSIDIRDFDTKAIEGKVKNISVESKGFDINTPGRFEFSLENTYGNVRISGTPASHVSLKAEKTAWGDTYEDAQKILDKLEIIYNKRRNRLNVEVRIPTLSGPRSGKPPRADFVISLPETLKQVYVKSIYGNIKANNIHSSIELRATSGDIEANVSGGMRISTTNGDIDIEAINSTIAASSTNGDVSVNAKDSKVSASTMNGEIKFRLESPNGTDARATNGGIDVDLKEVKNVEVTASTNKGNKINLIGFDKVEEKKGLARKSAIATLGNGDIKLKFSANTGDVEVKVSE